MQETEVLAVIAALLILGLGLAVFIRNPRSRKNQLLSLLSLGIFVWIGTVLMADLSTDNNRALWWSRAAIVGPAFLPYIFLWFTYVFPQDKNKVSRGLIALLAIPSLIILLLSPTSLNVESVRLQDWGTDFTPGPLYIFLLALLVLYMGLAFYNLIVSYREAKSIEKAQVKLLFYGIAVTLVLGIAANLVLPLLGYGRASTVGPSASLFLVGFTAYAITRYRFMDIRVALGRLLTALLVAAFAYAAFYGIIALQNELWGGVYATGAYLLGVPIAIGFCLIFLPLQRVLQRLTSRYLFSDLYNAQETISGLADKLTTIIDLGQIVDLVVETIRKTMNLDRSGVLLAEAGEGKVKYKIARVTGFNEKNGISLVQDSFLTRYLARSQKPLVRDELGYLAADSRERTEAAGFAKLKANMEKIEASLCLPLISGGKLSGIIVLGAKRSGNAYTREDLRLLSVLASQAAVAIENARLYQKVQDFNATLKEQVERQTKDLQEKSRYLQELLDMKTDFLRVVNHQLNTPLSIVKSSFAMMEDHSWEPDKAMASIKAAFERIAQTVSDFWSAYELEGERMKMAPARTDLAVTVANLVEEKKRMPLAMERKLRITVDDPGFAIPPVWCDPNKIAHVVSNLLDNAVHYTSEGWVQVKYDIEGKFLKVSVEDTGVGIAEQDRGRLFQKFSRGHGATLFHPDGSGLGLYIVKKIVEGNGGEITFFSAGTNQGATFSFTVPLYDNQAPAEGATSAAQRPKIVIFAENQ